MTFQSRSGLALLSLAVVLGAGSVSLVAQEAGGTAPRRAYNPARRVPSHYSQVGLSTEQREKIYSVREKYVSKVADLKKQITDLQAQELGDCEKVLTESQKKLLDQLRQSAGRQPKAEVKAPEPAKVAGPEKPKNG